MGRGERIVFLDVDGVLNASDGHYIDPTMISRLKILVDQFDLKIVLSSMWRIRKKNRKKLSEYFKIYQLPKPISCTPLIDHGHDRVVEILSWLYLNTTNVNLDGIDFDSVELDVNDEFKEKYYQMNDMIEIDQFVIIDDLDLSNDRFGSYSKRLTNQHFVRTPGRIGFTEHNAKQVSQLFTFKMINLCHLLPTDYCENCHTEKTIIVDKEANKFFCTSYCQELFYDKYNLPVISF